MADNCGIDILILILIVLFTIFLMTFILNNKIEKEKIIKNLESIKGTSAAQIARILKTEERNIERIYKIK